jgi:2'-5' RNA ligase
MSQLAVVAYPRMPADDEDWIETARARHDPQASRIRAHFTLAFPAEVEAEPLVEEVRATLARFKPFAVVLRRLLAVQDALAEGSHVFLVPEEGRRELLALHDRLYGGLLRPHLRADVPYEPHLTVGACPKLEACERIAEDLRRAGRTIQAKLQGAAVIDVSRWSVRTIVELPFGSEDA